MWRSHSPAHGVGWWPSRGLPALLQSKLLGGLFFLVCLGAGQHLPSCCFSIREAAASGGSALGTARNPNPPRSSAQRHPNPFSCVLNRSLSRELHTQMRKSPSKLHVSGLGEQEETEQGSAFNLHRAPNVTEQRASCL